MLQFIYSSSRTDYIEVGHGPVDYQQSFMQADRVEANKQFDVNYIAIATGWTSGVWQFMENTG